MPTVKSFKDVRISRFFFISAKRFSSIMGITGIFRDFSGRSTDSGIGKVRQDKKQTQIANFTERFLKSSLFC